MTARRWRKRIREAIPLRGEQKAALFTRFADVVRATVKGGILVAMAQGMLGGIAFWFLGIHAALLWAVLMAFLSLIPAIGATLVWLPVAIYFLATGAIWQGIGLILYGVLVIGLVDNLLRPFLVGKGSKLPDYVVLISTLGGIEVFGLNGFVIGPLIAAMFMVSWEIFSTSRQASGDDRRVGRVELRANRHYTVSAQLMGFASSTHPTLPQLKTGDAEYPLQPQRRNRAGIHAGRLEHRREPKILRQRDRLAVDAGHIQKNLAAAHPGEQGRQHRFGGGAVVGHQRADLETPPARTDHAPAGKPAFAHQRATDMRRRTDPRTQERRSRRRKHGGVVRLHRRERHVAQRNDAGRWRSGRRNRAAVSDIGVSEPKAGLPVILLLRRHAIEPDHARAGMRDGRIPNRAGRSLCRADPPARCRSRERQSAHRN